MAADLEAHYRRTEYCVQAGARRLVFSIDRHDAGAEVALTAETGDFRQWAIVTPCNPASVALCAEENAARLENFRRWLETSPYRWLDSRNRDPDGVWPDEPGALILDIPLAAAEALGRQYGQNAIVHARYGEPPRLLWLTEA
ncbi:MAG TPA: DUF3293 domain-containing protein [Nevskiales bacterium]|nr:DUF3293 domain-containing protein [Nevskiales bacterium]